MKDMTPDKTVAEMLEAAAQEIERSGHHKGWYWRDSYNSGPCCAIGAIRRVCGDSDNDAIESGPAKAADAAVDVLETYLRARGLLPARKWIPYWNDRTDAADVIAALRAAARSTP